MYFFVGAMIAKIVYSSTDFGNYCEEYLLITTPLSITQSAYVSLRTISRAEDVVPYYACDSIQIAVKRL
jgi:hypothetical protein